MEKTILWSRDEDHYRGVDMSGKHADVDSGTGQNKRGKYITNGFHHVVFVCRDMDETVKFYEETLGMKLRSIIPMHGCDGAKHCFIEAGNGCELSFIEFSKEKDKVPEKFKESPGTSHHMAFKTSSLEHLYNMRRQVKSTGIFVTPVINHGFVHSFYFLDPNDIQLEVSFTVRPYANEDLQLELLKAPVPKNTQGFSYEQAVKEARAYREKNLNSKL